MKIRKKRELQQTAFNHSSDIDFKNFMSLCTTKNLFNKTMFFFSIDATLASDNLLRFRENLSKGI